MVIFINLAIGLFLLTIGLTVHLGKNYNLIAGYNTMDDEEKELFNIKKFALHFGIAFYIAGFGTAISALLFYWFNIDTGYWIWILLALVLGVAGYLNFVGWVIKREDRNNRN